MRRAYLGWAVTFSFRTLSLEKCFFWSLTPVSLAFPTFKNSLDYNNTQHSRRERIKKEMLSDVKEQYKRAFLCSGFLSSLGGTSGELISKLYIFFFNGNLTPMKQARLAVPETRQFHLKSDRDQQEKTGFFTDIFRSTGKHPYQVTFS